MTVWGWTASTDADRGRRQRRGRPIVLVAAIVLAVVGGLLVVPTARAVAACGSSAVVCENQLPGTPESVWDVDGIGDASIQGFATKTSVNAGSRIDFKIDTDAAAYSVKIYRLGWYQGNGAREVATVAPSKVGRQSKPCYTDSSTEIYDCGGWDVSASWDVPSSAVSGVYIARLIRTDDGGDSHIPFVVRNDGNTSEIVMQTSDSTWQAYNLAGGSEFYHGKANGRAFKISYNRPYATRGTSEGRDFLFSNEYPMIRFLEQNGMDVSYVSGLDVGKDPALLPKHKVFLSVGHDEYWTKEQRKNVTDARDSGVSLGFFGGNDVYWKTRMEPSSDGTSTPDRTIVDYKMSWDDAVDPVEPTATWRDPRFGDLGYGYGPENALIGTQYQANSVDLALKVNADEGKLRFWRGTTAASMAPGAVATLSDHTVGYESNEDVDNGYRPAGLIHLSTTTGPTPEYSADYGRTVEAGTTTHHATLYRAASGALVFSAGTVQWSWGLDSHHDGTATPQDPRMRQATLNILRDMGAAPTTVADDLDMPTQSADETAPTVTVTAPAAGATITSGSLVTVSGTATDVGGRVAGVEVSVDGGSSFEPADGTASWSYTGVLTGNGPEAIQVRATDDSVRTSAPTYVAVSSPCPCTLFGLGTPTAADGGDGGATTVGVRFTASTAGFISGVRFYKSAANVGTHTGTLYGPDGGVMATGTFANETATGWQTLLFAQSVPIAAGTTYTAAYRAPNGHYSGDPGYFERPHVGRVLTAPGGQNVTNGVYSLGGEFPTKTYKHTNYWVDAIWSPTDTSPTVVSDVTPVPGATSVATTRVATATFNKVVDPATLMFQVTDADGVAIPGAATYDAATRRATFSPAQGLAPATTYTATVNAAGLAAPFQWSWTTARADAIPNVCPCTLFNESDQPVGGPDPDSQAVQLGMAFTPSATGQVNAIRFYKNLENAGPHTVTLWKQDGTKLAEATSSSESPSGWQQVAFDTPVGVSAATTYVASYLAGHGRYAYTANGLASKISNGPLSSLAKGGRYRYGDGPLTTTTNTNYFVDPVFNPSPDAAPVVRQLRPGNGATSVPVGAHVQATFDSDIQPGSASVTLTRSSDGTAVKGAVGSESQGSVVSFVPAEDLDPGTRYTVSVSGARNLGGTAMTSAYASSFTTAGAGACPCSLLDTSSTPEMTDSGDSDAVTVGLRFTPTVNGFVKGLRYYRDVTNTGTHTGSLWGGPTNKLASVTFVDGAAGWTTANFSSSVPVTAGTTYTASYYAPNGHYSADLRGFDIPAVNPPLTSAGPGGVFTYRNGYPDESYLNSNYYVDVLFTTSDDDPPSVTTVAPEAGAAGVPVDATASATFARSIDATSLSFTLSDPAGQLVGGQLGYDPTSRTATFSTGGPLVAGTTYTASVSANSSSGVTMTAPKTWTFTTADTAPPSVSSTAPAAGAVEISPSATIGATFSRPVDPASVRLILTDAATSAVVAGATAWDGATSTVTFRPTAALADLTGYTASVFASSVSGTAMAAPQTWTFTTADGAAPTVTASSPTSGATGVAGSSAVTATFTRAVDPTTVQLTLRNAAGDAIPGAVTYDATSRTARLVPTAALPGATTYTASVTAKNVSGVAMASPTTWSFTTADIDPPTLTARSPVAGATNVTASTNVTATFARPITAGTLVMTLRTPSGAAVPGALSYSSTTRTATFNPTSDLTSSTSYTASVSATSAAGVPMAAPTTWSFSTAAQSFSLYTTSRTPSATSTTTAPTTVGVRFSSSRAGKVTAVRYYAASTNTARTVKLWAPDGTLMGTATTTQTGTGWRTATFAAPVAVNAGTTYTASTFAPVGRWSTTSFAYLGSYTSGPLTVPAGGGVSSAGDVRPTTSSTTNFWVDVVVQI